MTVHFTIPGRLPGLNEYIRTCRSNKQMANEMKQTTEESIAWVLRAQCKQEFTAPVWIGFTWYEPNARRDYDNISGMGRKLILDAMQKAGLIGNDNRRYIAGFDKEVFLVDKDNPRVVVTVTEVDE